MNDNQEINMPQPPDLKKLIPNLLGLVALVLLVMFVFGFLHRTGSTDVGVRTVKFSLIPGQVGVQDNYYAPGAMYFFPPFFIEIRIQPVITNPHGM